MATYAVAFVAGCVMQHCESFASYRGERMLNRPDMSSARTAEEAPAGSSPAGSLKVACSFGGCNMNRKDFYAENDRLRAQRERESIAHFDGLCTGMRNEPRVNPCVGPELQAAWVRGYEEGLCRWITENMIPADTFALALANIAARQGDRGREGERRMRIDENTCAIPLAGGAVALVSPEDYERLAPFSWAPHYKWGYPQRSAPGRRVDPRRVIVMHREILSAPAGVEVDHRNGNPLDNRRENLRLATHAQNQQNTRKSSRGKSRFKGVCPSQHGGWRAQIYVAGVQQYLGRFDTEEQAARAYNQAAAAQFGEFARLNEIPKGGAS